MPQESKSKKLPERIGRYAVQRLIARGGMGSVYLARLQGEQGFGKWVAVKTVHSYDADDEQYREAFANEARLCARIDHPNVCQVFDYGEDDGMPYLAMEYLDGRPVNELLSECARRGDAIPRSIAARVIADAARGLHAAHELRTEQGAPANVVHRDVSPQNLFVLFSGSTKVMDFGIAKHAERTTEKTEKGLVKGKLAYMAPEQAQQKPLDRRTDVFALGAVLWELLAGRRLFRADNDAATLKAVLFDPIPTPSSVRPDVPPALEGVAMRALARDPDERYPTAERMARDLENWLAKDAGAAGVSEVAAFMGFLFEEARDTGSVRAEPKVTSNTTELPTTALSAKKSGPAVEAPPVAREAAATVRPPLKPTEPALEAPKPAAKPAMLPGLVSAKDEDWRAEFRGGAAEPGLGPAPLGAPPPTAASSAPPKRSVGSLPDKYGTGANQRPLRTSSGPGLGSAIAGVLLLFVAASLLGFFPPGQRAITSLVAMAVGAERAAGLLNSRAGSRPAPAAQPNGSANVHIYTPDPSTATPEDALGQARVVRSRGTRPVLTDDSDNSAPLPARRQRTPGSR